MADERNLFREPKKNVYVPATLTQDELSLRDRINLLKEQIAESRRTLQKYQDSCTHSVFYDQQGIPYTIRFCGICERKLETL
jgi:hypothetical protein